MTRAELGLPPVPDRRVAVRVTPAALRAIRRGHPWVFDRSITHVGHDAPPGSLAVVFDDRRRFAAIGLWDPTSPLRIRIVQASEQAEVGRDLWQARFDAAMSRRQVLVADTATTGYRLLNGESDGFPGLVADRYGDTVVVKVYSPAWFPHLADVLAVLEPMTGRVVLRLGRLASPHAPAEIHDGLTVRGEASGDHVEFLEHGLAFRADVVRGHKTGHFLDQRDNRALVGERSGDARVLDVFACTGGFSVHAAAGGARQVHAVDLSVPALRAAAANVDVNRDRREVAACRFSTEAGDAFEALDGHRRAGRSWDVVVIDPPSFAPRQDRVPGALSAYARLTRLGVAVTRPGGLLVQSSCSSRVDEATFHRLVADTAAAQGRPLDVVARTAHPVDHPASFPEALYLKTVFAHVPG